MAFVQVVGTFIATRHDQGLVRPLGWLGYGLLVASALALAPRRRYRIASMVVVVALTLTYYLLAFPGGPFFLAAFLALAGGIIAGKRPATWVVAGLGYAVVALVGSVDGKFIYAGYAVPNPSLGGLIALGAWILLTLAIAEAFRNRASALAEIGRTRAEQARARTEQQRRQTSDERLRIAQELHDVVGHHLSLINVQAGVGLHLMDDRPEQARVALTTIKAASSEALAEVRAVLGLLRAEEGEQAPRAPAPSLANLSVLLDSSGARLVTQGTERPLPPEVDRAGYRIVREALTNVRRHAGDGATATVTIGYLPGELSVVVADDGTGATGAPADGNGLAGMRARAEALGGTLSAGSVPTGGFQVAARLPLPSLVEPAVVDEEAGEAS